MYPRNLLTSFIPQLIRSRLEELDRQTQAIDAHVTRLAGVTPVKEDEVCSIQYTHVLLMIAVSPCPLLFLCSHSLLHIILLHIVYTLCTYMCVSPHLSFFSSYQSLCAQFKNGWKKFMCMLYSWHSFLLLCDTHKLVTQDRFIYTVMSS